MRRTVFHFIFEWLLFPDEKSGIHFSFMDFVLLASGLAWREKIEMPRRIRSYMTVSTPATPQAIALHMRSVTPDPSIPMYSDVTQRHCDRKLLELHQQASESIVRDRKSPLRRARSVADFVAQSAKLATTALTVTKEKKTRSSSASVKKERNEKSDVVSADVQPPTSIPTGELLVSKAKSVAEFNPILPSEALAVLLPGVSPMLIAQAAKRQKRALRRRRDYLKLQAPTRSPTNLEDQLFPQLQDLSSSDDGNDEEDLTDTDRLALLHRNDGGVDSPRCFDDDAGAHFVADSEILVQPESSNSALLVRSTVATTFSKDIVGLHPSSADVAYGIHAMPTEEHCHAQLEDIRCNRQKCSAVRVRSLPLTAEYEHLIRMNRHQQLHRKIPKDFKLSHSDQLGRDNDRTGSLQGAATFPDPSNDTPSNKSLALAVPMLRLKNISHANESETKSLVPKLRLGFMGNDGAGGDSESAAPSSTEDHDYSSIRRRRPGDECSQGSPVSVAASELPSTVFSGQAHSVQYDPPALRRKAHSAQADLRSSVGDEPYESNTEGRLRPSRMSSDDDDGEEENVEDLRRQFASFIRRRAVPDEDADEADSKISVKPFEFPEVFVKYSLSRVRADTSTGGSRKRQPHRQRLDSLIEFDTDRSTPVYADTVKIIWGSAPTSSESSAVSRTAAVRFVVEFLFRRGQHHFDAQHIYHLMEPYTHYVLDLEAGNRGGKFMAIYANSELQCLKAVAAMMGKIRRGESHLFEDVYCATSPVVPSAMLCESPRDGDMEAAPLETDNAEDEAPDPMQWFRKHAVHIADEIVNHHAPGALDQYRARVDKKRRQAEREKRKKKSRRSLAESVVKSNSKEVGASGAEDSAVAALPSWQSAATKAVAVVEEEKDNDVEADLFVAEGDEVKGLDELKSLMDAADKNFSVIHLKKSSTGVDGDADCTAQGDPLVTDVPAEKPSIFSQHELSDAEVALQMAKPALVSVMELAARSKYTPEELRKMRLGFDKRRRLSRSQLIKLERLQQSTVRSIKEYRDAKALEMLETMSSSSRRRRSSGKPSRSRRNAKALFAKRKRRRQTGEVTSESDDNAKEEDGNELGVDQEAAAGEHNQEEAVIPAGVQEPAVGDTSLPGNAERSFGDSVQQAKERRHLKKLKELDDNEAIDAFNEFLQQYATSEKVAIVAPMLRFDDPSIPPPPCAESDAEDLIFLLRQMDYDIVVMMPPLAPVHPGDDASPEDLAEYEEQLEYDRTRWFLTPTAENIAEVTEALLQQNPGGRYCCVALFLITRGFVGGLQPKLLAPQMRSEQLVALTIDSDLADLTKETTFNPREFTHKMKTSVKRVPMIFVDTYPLPDVPHSDAYGAYIAQVASQKAQYANGGGFQTPQPAVRSPAPAFVSFSAQPEDGGSEVVAMYPKYAGGLGTYYLKRALEGRACPPKSLVMTMNSLIWYLSAKLQSRGCRVNHNAVVPKSYSSLRPYFDLSLVYDSAYELRRNLDTAHVIEITTAARVEMKFHVRIEPSLYISESFSFMFAPHSWGRQLRRDLSRMLYPKRDAAPFVVVKGVRGAPSKVVTPSVKPRPEKALRLKYLFCTPQASSLLVQYNDCPEMLFDDKRFRQVEKDIAKINESCLNIQLEEPHGFVFANGAHLLPLPSTPVRVTVPYITARNVASPMSARRLSELGKPRTQQTVSSSSWLEHHRHSFNRWESDLKMLKDLVPNRVVTSSRIPVTQYCFLTTGVIRLQFNGYRKRLQQDFAINYFVSGCQKTTIPGTSTVSLHKRPSHLWGEVEVTLTGNRRDFRKLDRFRREQVFMNRLGGESLEITEVKLDLFDFDEHAAALQLQKCWRGTLVRQVISKQRALIVREESSRQSTRDEEHSGYTSIVGLFYFKGLQLLQQRESENRRDTFYEESENRVYLIDEARRLLRDLFMRARDRLMCEEGIAASPLFETALRLNIEARQAFEWAWLLCEFWFLHGVMWDRYYLEMDVYQEILRARNYFRDTSQLDRYHLGYLMDHPTPPSTFLDSGRSIIRGILEEKSRRARKLAREKAMQDKLVAIFKSHANLADLSITVPSECVSPPAGDAET